METIVIAGVTYSTRIVTLADVNMADLVKDGTLDQLMLLKAAIVRPDGGDIDWTTMPIGHATRLLPLALKAAGFTTDDATGNA